MGLGQNKFEFWYLEIFLPSENHRRNNIITSSVITKIMINMNAMIILEMLTVKLCNGDWRVTTVMHLCAAIQPAEKYDHRRQDELVGFWGRNIS